MVNNGDITQLLSDWAAGDEGALERLAPVVYPELRALAGSFFRAERPNHTLQATALVNELFVKLIQRRENTFENRKHFYALSARLMRYLLVDHARANKAAKRGNPAPLHQDLPWLDSTGPEALDLDAALTEFAALDPEQEQMVELRYLLGCTVDETADILGVSRATVDRKVRLARGWLYLRLRGQQPPSAA